MRFHGFRRFLTVSTLMLPAMLMTPVQAQYAQAPVADTASRDWNDEIPAHLSFVEGSVTLEREGKLEPAEANVALLAGDRLRTRSGRVEILFADGSALYLDEQTTLDLLSGSLARLLTGRIQMTITRATAELEYRVDAPAASVWIKTAGEYRIDVREAREVRRPGSEVDLYVARGSAELVNEHGRTLVRAGTHAIATADLAPSLPYVANSAGWDEFDEWIDRQRNARLGTYSNRYLPTELRYYSGSFDSYGSWDYLPAHGYVWYPRVSSGWRPYSQGRWSFSAHFGWFWVGIDRWSWATHHYGRWGVHSGAWYWIPDRRWAPAWVYWGSAPGYVSWCPIGWDGRPVYGFRHADPWSAWTILPHRYFAPNVWVTQHIVVHNTIAPTIRTQFVERAIAPYAPAIATPRVAPIYAPTATRATAVPRNGQAAYSGEEAWRSQVVRGGASPRSGTAATSAASGAAPSRMPAASRATIDDGRPATENRAGTPNRGAAVSRDGRYATQQPETNAQRATPPEHSRIAPQDRTIESPRVENVPRASVPRVESPRIESPRVESPRGQAPRTSVPDNDTRRAAPRGEPVTRGDDQPRARGRSELPPVEYSRPSAPAQRTEESRGPSRAPERAAPRESLPRYGGGEPPRQSAPPPPPDRGPSRVPDRAAPAPRESAPPPAAAPPPSRGRGGYSGASSAPPSSAPPSSRGGGSDAGAAPRGRGRGGQG